MWKQYVKLAKVAVVLSIMTFLFWLAYVFTTIIEPFLLYGIGFERGGSEWRIIISGTTVVILLVIISVLLVSFMDHAANTFEKWNIRILMLEKEVMEKDKIINSNIYSQKHD